MAQESMAPVFDLHALVSTLALNKPVESFGPFVFCMMGYCIHFAITLLPSTRHLSSGHSFGLTLFTAFGGGTIVPILLGAPAYILWDDRAVPVLFVAWAGARYSRPLRAFAATIIGDVLLSCTFQIFRTKVIVFWMTKAAGILAASPLLHGHCGVILCGMLAGSGGLFVPLDKGLSHVSHGSPFPVTNALWSAIFYHFGMVCFGLQYDLHNPDMKSLQLHAALAVMNVAAHIVFVGANLSSKIADSKKDE